jgi:hypothetical protein
MNVIPPHSSEFKPFRVPGFLPRRASRVLGMNFRNPQIRRSLPLDRYVSMGSSADSTLRHDPNLQIAKLFPTKLAIWLLTRVVEASFSREEVLCGDEVFDPICVTCASLSTIPVGIPSPTF